MKRLTIISLHKELLGTYGDQGNVEVLAHRGGLLGYEVKVAEISYRDLVPDNGDIYLLGGAEDSAQILSAEALRRDGGLQRAKERSAVILGVCAGFQILGNSYFANGVKQQGLGLLDVDSFPGEKRSVGEIRVTSLLNEEEMSGFENHSGQTRLGGRVLPLHRVKSGIGNGDGRYDGAMNTNVFGTYLHGPVLARNPHFADHLIARATAQSLQFAKDLLADEYASAALKI